MYIVPPLMQVIVIIYCLLIYRLLFRIWIYVASAVEARFISFCVCKYNQWKWLTKTKAVTQHFLEKSFKKLQMKNKRKLEMSWKTHTRNVFFSECLLPLGVLPVFLCCSVCLFLYESFWDGALKHDISTLFTAFFLWTSLQFILTLSIINCTHIVHTHLLQRFDSVRSMIIVMLLPLSTFSLSITQSHIVFNLISVLCISVYLTSRPLLL